MGNYKFNEIRFKQSVVKQDACVINIVDLEIDRNCFPQSGNVCNSWSENQFQLYKYSELPHFLQGNPFVESGYRVFLSSSLCLRSMFFWTNETVNIWSHVFGFFLFFFLMIYDNVVMASREGLFFSDHLVMTVGLICYQFCMLCSAGFHLFHCHSDEACRWWLGLDLAGISIGLIGCYVPAVHLAFYCALIWRDTYLFVVMSLAAATLAVQLHPRFLSPSWMHKRALLYSGLAAYGIVPAIHWVHLSGGLDSPVVQIFFPKIAGMYCLAVIAFGFYFVKCPERCFPGRFDYIGSSHQCWHIMIVVAFFYWRCAGKDILEYRLTVPCHIRP